MTDKELSAEELIKSLSPNALASLKKKLNKVRSTHEHKVNPKYQTGWMLVTHNYNCEICGEVRSKQFNVKVQASVIGIKFHQKPLELYTICNVCTKRFIIGLALARSMVTESNERR